MFKVTDYAALNMWIFYSVDFIFLSFGIITAGVWDCVAAAERLPALYYSVDFFLVLWDHGFHSGTLKLLEGH